MRKQPARIAHEELSALARIRREAAERLPPPSPAQRARLQEEVSRVLGSPPATAHAVPAPPQSAVAVETPFPGRRSLWAWITIPVAAAALLLFMIWRPQPERLARVERSRPVPAAPLSPQDLERVLRMPPSLADGSVEMAQAPASPASDLSLGARSVEDRGTTDPQSGVAAAAASPGDLSAGAPLSLAMRSLAAPGAVPAEAGPAPREVSGFEAPPPPPEGQPYRAEDPAPPVLRAFRAVRAGDRLELHDMDGSVYIGRLSGVGSDRPWLYEARGRSVSHGQSVWITGTLRQGASPVSEVDGTEVAEVAPRRAARTGTAASAEQSVMDRVLEATVMIGDSEIHELRAVPVAEEE